eukprot:m.12229 g.12229  ORF g.12229 m.12229 type:complete len:499 (+) comp23895_c0_seq1:109-1605(+)
MHTKLGLAVFLLVSIATAITEGVTFEDCGLNETLYSDLFRGNGNGNGSGSGGGPSPPASGQGPENEKENFTSCGELSSILAINRRTAAPRVTVVVATSSYFISTSFILESSSFTFSSTSKPPGILTKSAELLTSSATAFATPSGRPMVPSSSLILPSPTLVPSPSPTTTTASKPPLTPTPTLPVSPTNPIEEEVRNNALEIVMTDQTEDEWDGQMNEVADFVAKLVTDHCRSSPSNCGLASPSTFAIDASHVKFTTLTSESGELVVKVIVAFPSGTLLWRNSTTESVIPRETLQNLLNKNATQIAELSGAASLLIRSPTDPTSPSPTVAIDGPNNSFPVGAVVGGVAGGLVVLALIIVAIVLWKNKKTGGFEIRRVQPVREGKDVERAEPNPPTAVQTKHHEAWASPPSKNAKSDVTSPPAAFPNPLATEPLRPTSPLEDIPLSDFNTDVTNRTDEQPGTVPKRHTGRASNPDIWPEAKKVGRMSSKSTMPPIGSQAV